MASGDKVSVSKVVGAAVEGAASSLVPGKKAFEVTAAVLNGLKSGYQNYKKNKSVGKALVAGTVSAGLSYAGGNSAKKMQKQIDGAEKRKIVKKVTKKVIPIYDAIPKKGGVCVPVCVPHQVKDMVRFGVIYTVLA